VKLRKGDTVRVITGKEKGKEGVIEHVWRPGKLALLARVQYLVASSRKALRR